MQKPKQAHCNTAAINDNLMTKNPKHTAQLLNDT